jgi:hypothetical protein
MIELHRNHGEPNPVAILPHAHQVTEDAERRPSEPESDIGPHVEIPSHRNWEMLLIYGLLTFSFAAFLFCFLTISAKCRGDWPFQPAFHSDGTRTTSPIGTSR